MFLGFKIFFQLLFQTLYFLTQKETWRLREINHWIVSFGVGSLPLVVVSTAFAGVLITTEMAWHMDQALHTVTMIPGFTGQFILREVGVAIPALLLVSKVGASTTAEVGSMKITDQIDALKLLGIQPVAYLVAPRVIASVVSGVCLTLIAIAVTLGCALIMAVARNHFSVAEYLNTLKHFVSSTDLIRACLKSASFAFIIPIISCGYGFVCEEGAQGVGTATTQSVVSATIGVILLDFFWTLVFTLDF